MPDTNSHPPRRRWYQFSLRTFLIAILVIGFGSYWLVRHEKVRKARLDYARKNSLWDAGAATSESMLEASAVLCRAEEQMPFADKVRARALHLVRISEVVYRQHWSIYHGEGLMGAGDDEHVQQIMDHLRALEDFVTKTKEELRAAQGAN